MRPSRRGEKDPLFNNGLDYAAYVSEQDYSHVRNNRLGRLARRAGSFALPACLVLGLCAGFQSSSAHEGPTTHVITSDPTNQELPDPTGFAKRDTPSATQPEEYSASIKAPGRDADEVWVAELREELAQQSVQVIDAPSVVEDDQVLISIDGECGTLVTFSTPGENPYENRALDNTKINMVFSLWGPLDYFTDIDTLAYATHALGVIAHEEGDLIYGTDIAREDLSQAQQIITSEAPRLCEELEVSLR